MLQVIDVALVRIVLHDKELGFCGIVDIVHNLLDWRQLLCWPSGNRSLQNYCASGILVKNRLQVFQLPQGVLLEPCLKTIVTSAVSPFNI